MRIIKQSTYETCLAACLLMLFDGARKDEIELWKQGWKFNYLIGQLNYAAKKYKKSVTAYVENKYYFNQLKTQNDPNVNLVNHKISADFLKDALSDGPVIIYLDNFYLQKIVHAPHFVVAKRLVGDKIEIIDPFDGKIKKIPFGVMEQSIESLRSHLKYSPVLISKSCLNVA